MDPDLNRLFDNILHCSHSLKLAVDNTVNSIMALKEASLKCEETYQKDKAAYHSELEHLGKELVELRKKEMHERRAVQFAKEELERTKKIIDYEKRKFRDQIEDAHALVAEQRAAS